LEQHVSAADPWIADIFAARAAANGGVIRRSRVWVDNEIGRDRFMNEVRARGFPLLETGHQLRVVCHKGAIHMYF
jgi:hypothetical protein